MTEISNLLQAESKTIEAIYADYKRKGDSEKERGYLGASIIGHSCERFLWYTFRSCVKNKLSGRMYRLFETGDKEESRLIQDLRNIGCEVHDSDPSTGEQFAVEAFGGHLSGHLDGCVLGVPEAPKTWHVCEFKTHNNKSFQKLKKEGVKQSKPMHYAQMQVYMGLTGMTRALYLAVCKDTDELYSERVRFDKDEFDSLMKRAERIITSSSPPERISNRPDYYECSYCDAKEICWGSSNVSLPITAINCRQCCHATPTMDGKACWKCEKHNRGLSESDQSKACDDHLVLPGLISFAESTDFSDDTIKFVNNFTEGPNVWKHGKDGFSTKELMSLSTSALTNPMLKETKRVFGCEAVSCGQDILASYPESDSEIVWRGPIERIQDAWYDKYKERLGSEVPILKCEHSDYCAAEFSDGRVTILWKQKEFGKQIAEIRQGKI